MSRILGHPAPLPLFNFNPFSFKLPVIQWVYEICNPTICKIELVVFYGPVPNSVRRW
jgi:hypothetical protein